MKIEREAHKIETAAGTFYVMVLTAHLSNVSRFDEQQNSHLVEECRPRVWIATDPEFKGDATLGHIKIRGRKYTIDHQVQQLPEGIGSLVEGKVEFTWNNEPMWGGPYRNESGTEVSFRSKTYDVLYDLEREALDQFAKEYPEWVTESKRLRMEHNRDHEASKAAGLRKEAEQAEQKAAQWQARIDALAA